jgi:hypothetical protein
LIDLVEKLVELLVRLALDGERLFFCVLLGFFRATALFAFSHH